MTCSCGQRSRCPRKIHSTSNGKLYVKTDEHLQCGKVQKQIEDILRTIKTKKK